MFVPAQGHRNRSLAVAFSVFSLFIGNSAASENRRRGIENAQVAQLYLDIFL